MSEETPASEPPGIPPSGASNPTPAPETSIVAQPEQPLEETEEHRQPELPKILEPIYRWFVRLFGRRWGPPIWICAVVVLSVGSAIVTILWTLALWDSYYPKVTISPGGTLNAKSPFGTYFIIKNEGDLPISNIEYLTQLEPIPLPGMTVPQNSAAQEQNVTVIPEMRSLESYSLNVSYAQFIKSVGMIFSTTNEAASANTTNTATANTNMKVFKATGFI